MNIAARLTRMLLDAEIAIDGVSIGDEADKSTWRVCPTEWQAIAQPAIDAFDPNDPAHDAAEKDLFASGEGVRPIVRAMVIYHARERFKDANARYPTAEELAPLVDAARTSLLAILKVLL
jgi:hypothetical protein